MSDRVIELIIRIAAFVLMLLGIALIFKQTTMSNKTITQLAEEISFRLLATKKHDDFDWLVETLTEYIEDEHNEK